MKSVLYVMIVLLVIGCSKGGNNTPAPPTQPIAPFKLIANTIDGKQANPTVYNVSVNPVVRFSFSAAIEHTSVANSVSFKDNAGNAVAYTASYENKDSVLLIQPASPLKYISVYTLAIQNSLLSQANGALQASASLKFTTGIDTADKFPRISDSALLTLVQQQTFKYFWDNANLTSGLAKERASQDVVTIGGSGFGIMSILTGIKRSFITRQQGLDRIQTAVNFLTDTNKVKRYHGAFSHWIDGSTGATIPFGTQDNGGDIVETSYLMAGLLTARQYFNNTTDAQEIALRDTINKLYGDVEWSWYRQNDQNVLFWNWSPDYAWNINVKISGWNEALITYVLAASAPKDSITKAVYDIGWARNGLMANGNSFYGIKLPLGPDYGGPLFFTHYSFLGIDPHGLSDHYANYWTQDTAHAKINYQYCVANPKKYNGYSSQCWGLTASDEQNGYSAHSPSNDNGVISPTAAVASMPYTPAESMAALRYFYYKLGDKAWGQYGFIDAFNLTSTWYDNDFLAIDQGPQIVMLENYRSGLLWDLFMSCPEVANGMKKLGFQSPHF